MDENMLILDAVLLYLSPISKLKFYSTSKKYHILMGLYDKRELFELFMKTYSCHKFRVTHIMLPWNYIFHRITLRLSDKREIFIDKYSPTMKNRKFVLKSINVDDVQKIKINIRTLTINQSEIINKRHECISLLDFNPVHTLLITPQSDCALIALTGPIIFYNQKNEILRS
jgi:hypothetical protein